MRLHSTKETNNFIEERERSFKQTYEEKQVYDSLVSKNISLANTDDNEVGTMIENHLEQLEGPYDGIPATNWSGCIISQYPNCPTWTW